MSKLGELRAQIGQPLGTSPWRTVGQDDIDAFAAATGDDQFIHVDPERARTSPFGGTVAHGLLTLSLLSIIAREAVPLVRRRRMGVNYGFDRVRFVSPVRSGARVRGHFALGGVTPRPDDGLLLRFDASVEIEGEDKPALSAQWLVIT